MALLRGASAATAALGRAAARPLSTTAASSYGGLADQDRIFQNLYGKHDWGIKGAMARVSKNNMSMDWGDEQIFFGTA